MAVVSWTDGTMVAQTMLLFELTKHRAINWPSTSGASSAHQQAFYKTRGKSSGRSGRRSSSETARLSTSNLLIE